ALRAAPPRAVALRRRARPARAAATGAPVGGGRGRGAAPPHALRAGDAGVHRARGRERGARLPAPARGRAAGDRVSALLRKELRGLLPVWVLVLFVLGVLDIA